MMNNMTTDMIDPNLGMWTPSLVSHYVNSVSEESFYEIYGYDKKIALAMIGVPFEESLPVKEDVIPEPKKEVSVKSSFIEFDPENEDHLDDKKNLHWKKFEKKYGVKQTEL